MSGGGEFRSSLALAPILPAEREAVQAWVPTTVLLGSLLLFVLYLRLVLAGQDDFAAPEPILRPPRPPVPPSPVTPPESRNTSAGDLSDEAGGSDPRTETAGLLRVLDAGPDFQRQAAARALSIPFAGTSDPRVQAALLAIVDRSDCGVGSRAEAYCALRIVAGVELAWDDEVKLRHGFPEGLDEAWLTGLREALPGESKEG